MMTESNLQEQPAAARTIATELLYLIELTLLRLDHTRFLAPYRSSEDCWFATRHEKVEGPFTFHEILVLLCQGESPLPVLHASQAQSESAEWHVLTYTPFWANKTKALLWTIALWSCVTVTGFVIVQRILGHGLPVALLYWFIVAFLIGAAALKRRKVRLVELQRAFAE